MLATALREGTLDLHDDAVRDHLIRTAIAKLEVDQPTYPGFRALSD